MLLDLSVSKVKRAMLEQELAKESWSYLIANGNTDKYKALRANVEKFLNRHLPWIPIEAFDGELAYCKPQGLPLSGRGVAVLKHSDNGRGGHIVAFENGFVFDPAKPLPMPIEAFQFEATKRNKAVLLVVTQPNTEEK